jgi:hypothetical protein
MKTYALLWLFVCFTSLSARAETQYRVIDNSHSVCETQALYQQLVTWSLYGVGNRPGQGCFNAPAHANAVILECPEDDMMPCRFRLTPQDGSPALEVWASKVMLEEIP